MPLSNPYTVVLHILETPRHPPQLDDRALSASKTTVLPYATTYERDHQSLNLLHQNQNPHPN